jgi:fibronectin-binding autotransporter adhesin
VLDASVVFDTPHGVNAFYLSPSSTAQTLAGNGSVLGNVFANNPAYLVPGGTNGIGTLSFSNNLSLGNMTAFFELNTAVTPGNGINDLVNVGGDIDPGISTVFVTTLSPLTSPATYRLFNYNGAKLNSFAGVSLQTDTRYTFGIDDLTTTNQVNLTVNGTAGNLIWTGANGTSWNLYTAAPQNWTFNGNADYFYNADSVTFDDTPGLNSTVSIDGVVRPYSVMVNDDLYSYTFTGSGKITGSTGLTKTGTGTLTLTAGNCDFTGPVTVNQGVVSVSMLANIGSPSTLGAASTLVLNGGTFQFTGAANRTWNRFVSLGSAGGTVDSSSSGNYLFLTNTISGTGSLTKVGAKQLIIGESSGTGGTSIAGSNTYSGNTYINLGEVQLRNAHALGFGKAVVANGCDLAFGGGGNYGTMTNNIDLNGDGPGSAFSGALQVNDASTSVTFGGTINLVANSSVGCQTLPGSFTISGPIIGAAQLTKQNHVNCTVILTCPTNSYSGGTVVVGGTLQLGTGASCGSLGSGAVTNGGTLAYNHSDSITNNSAISGIGNVTHARIGTLTLGGANTYYGATAINGGTVVVNGALAGGAVTVANGATLGGYGTIGGPVTINSGGTLALGASIGTLTINNILNLGGTNVMKVSHVTNDVIQGVSTLSFGGALNIVVVGSLQGGETFKLFNATTYGAAFTSTNLPTLGGNLAWDASGLGTGTLKVVSTAVPQPTFNPPFRRSDGNLQLTFSGQSGSNYRVWATTNLAFAPITTTWSNLSSGTFSGAPVTYTDLQATNYARRFYAITIP